MRGDESNPPAHNTSAAEARITPEEAAAATARRDEQRVLATRQRWAEEGVTLNVNV